MPNILRFLREVLGHWGSLLTGGILVAVFWVLQGYGLRVSPLFYGISALIAFLSASFYAWNAQKERAELAESRIKRDEGPQLFLTYSLPEEAIRYPGLGITDRLLYIENRGPTDAYNVQIDPICLSRQRAVIATFPIGWWPRFASVLWTLTWVEENSLLPVWGLPLPIARRPFRLDFDCCLLPERIVPKAAPLPIARFLDQASLDRISVRIA
jgi:hypothetical protein